MTGPKTGVAKTARSAPVSPKPTRAQFDMADRERIRGAMLRYMEAHGIGVPTLQVRIAEAADRSIDLIPLKTLQRFLAGASRTNDAFLVPCHLFVSGLPDHAGPEQAVPTLAQLVERFFGLGEQEAESENSVAVLEPGASYFVWTTPKRGPGIRLSTDSQKYPIPYAWLSIETTPDAGAGSVRERVVNPARLGAFRPGDAETRHTWEGGLTARGQSGFVLLRNTLTRLPKCYGLGRRNDHLHEGYAIETPFLMPEAGGASDMSPLSVGIVHQERAAK